MLRARLLCFHRVPLSSLTHRLLQGLPDYSLGNQVHVCRFPTPDHGKVLEAQRPTRRSATREVLQKSVLPIPTDTRHACLLRTGNVVSVTMN